jgi:hypothetical protein
MRGGEWDGKQNTCVYVVTHTCVSPLTQYTQTRVCQCTRALHIAELTCVHIVCPHTCAHRHELGMHTETHAHTHTQTHAHTQA